MMIQIPPKLLDSSDELSSCGESPSPLSDQSPKIMDDVSSPQFVTRPSLQGRMPTEELEQAVGSLMKKIKRNSVQTTSISASNLLRQLVSKKKRRYDIDGFDLDLTYINERIIAFGFPAENVESVYRNSIADVKAFFNSKHPNHYMIINLCSERKYKHSHFNGMVREFPFNDHQAPPFRLIFEVCQFIDEWLNSDPENVIGVHCKAGKGRTGLMIACYLLYAKQFYTAKDALRYYGMIRTNDGKGVTIPSQIRYVHYFESALKSQWKLSSYPRSVYELVSVTMEPTPNINIRGGCEPYIVITNNSRTFTSKDRQPINCYKSGQLITFDNLDFLVEEDFLVEVYNNSLLTQEKILQFWLHANFLLSEVDVMLTKNELDIAVGDKENKRFAESFCVKVKAAKLNKIRVRSKPVFVNPVKLLN